MTISNINQNIHADMMKSVGTAPSTHKNRNEAETVMDKMVENHPTQHSIDRAKLVYRVNVKMRQSRNFRQRQAARQAGRRRQLEKGKGRAGSTGSNGGRANSITEVSMSSSMGDNSGSGGKDHPDGLLKKKQHNRKKTGHTHFEDNALGISDDGRDPIAAADKLVDEQNRELERYRQWRKNLEAKLFDDMYRRRVSLRELNQYKRKTSELLGNESYINQNIEIL